MRPPDLFQIFLYFFGITTVRSTLQTVRDPSRDRPADRRGEDLRAGDASIERCLLDGAHLAGAHALRRRACALSRLVPAGDVCRRPADHVWRAGMASDFGLTQHAGLAEDVLDHRLNSRTVYMNPDLPLHLLEHELSRRAPHVPDGALSRAAAAACGDASRTCRGPIRARLRPIARSFRRLLRQLKEPTWTIVKRGAAAGRRSPIAGGAKRAPCQAAGRNAAINLWEQAR